MVETPLAEACRMNGNVDDHIEARIPFKQHLLHLYGKNRGKGTQTVVLVTSDNLANVPPHMARQRARRGCRVASESHPHQGERGLSGGTTHK